VKPLTFANGAIALIAGYTLLRRPVTEPRIPLYDTHILDSKR
jgi:hypothetical protein